jgi:hypothetical protein
MGKLPSRNGSRGLAARTAALAGLVLAQLCGGSGCTRHFFRERADAQVDRVLAEKDRYPEWKIENEHVYPDPRARFADSTNPDRPPMPPDDPAAQSLSPNPQKPGKAGIARVEGTGYLELLAQWDAENRANQSAADELEAGNNKKSQEPVTATVALFGCPSPRRVFRIRLEQAAELGLINSREYQDRREDLYLAALPVTLERFAFAAQWFAAGQAIREWTGRGTPEGQHNEWVLNSDVGFTKLFSTGALLLLQIANQTVINMTGTGSPHTVSESTLTLDLMQPLLRGGGRAVTLEPLTQTERNLLYEIRSYAHFRKEFFTFIVGGGGLLPGAILPRGGTTSIVPGVPASLIGLTINTPPVQITPGTSGQFTLNPAVSVIPAGFLPTLLPAAQLVTDRDNVTQLRAFYKLFEAFKEGGDVSQLQVDLVEQQLLQGESTVLQDEQTYGNLLDELKLQLGLPVDVGLELDNAPVRALLQQFKRYSDIFTQFENARNQAAGNGPPEHTADVRARLEHLFAATDIVQSTTFRLRLPGQWAEWHKLSDNELRARLQSLGGERRALLEARTNAEQAGKRLSGLKSKRLDEIESSIDLGSMEQVLRAYESEPWQGQGDVERRQRQRVALFQVVVNSFALVLGEARNERLQKLRQSWPELPRLLADHVDLLTVEEAEAQAKVAQVALLNRLDLMNARASVVDSWRQIAVFANALLGTLNVEYHWDSFTPLGQAKPLDFGGSRNRQQLFINGELPLVRTKERNDYRAALIAYQRQRRALMESEDLAVAAVRSELRQLRILAQNYKIQQRQVELAYLTVESSLDTFRAPPAPTPAGTAANTAVSAASLTQQLLGAQRSLPVAQDALLAVWISYLTTRLQLYRDLELMQIDSRGVWIDEFATSPTLPEPSDGAEQLGQPTPLGPSR